jgi:signal transduction histidine kinase
VRRLWDGARGANPLVWDSLLALVIMVASLLGLQAEPTELTPTPTDPLAVLLVVVGTGVLAIRRRNPLIALWVAMATTAVSAIRDYLETGLPIAVIITFYTAASLVPRRKWLPAAGVIVGFLAFMAIFRGEDVSVGNFVANLAIYGIAAAFGDSTATRRANTRALELRAEALEQNQAIQAEQAVAEERLRIARQLHDVVAHALAVIAVQSGVGGHVIDTDPGEAKRVLDNINQASRETLDEMRRMLGVLRGEDGSKMDLAPAPGLGDLDQLVKTIRDAGVEVTLEVTGDQDRVPAGTALTAFRIVQEALTNVLKHAGPARADVKVACDPGVIRVEVCDDGRGAATTTDPSVTHLGLIGMRERVTPYGGELDVGPRAGGGWRVCATLPYERVTV